MDKDDFGDLRRDHQRRPKQVYRGLSRDGWRRRFSYYFTANIIIHVHQLMHTVHIKPWIFHTRETLLHVSAINRHPQAHITQRHTKPTRPIHTYNANIREWVKWKPQILFSRKLLNTKSTQWLHFSMQSPLSPVGHSSNHEYHYCQLTRQSCCVSNFYRTFKVFIWLPRTWFKKRK